MMYNYTRTIFWRIEVMPAIYYNTLNGELKKAISARAFSVAQLLDIHANIKEELDKKKKVLNIVMICVAVVFIVMGAMTCIKAGNPDLTKFMILLFVPVIEIMYFLVYFTQVGLMKTQFNNAIKKNYPELEEDLKL